ncbi:unnamed protein product [Clonostachys rhizophaga]|uniref:Methyltransferase type 11 domain-containing protein n=1 Tax=Clonostachys rhizophaga TaxID=160324 RepID=A0A9N9YLP8_9HYPO|nr:unnamed protein product [Clonostachys rhizophaga]
MQSVAIWETVAVVATLLILSSVFFVPYLRQDRPPWAHTSRLICRAICVCAGVLLLASIVLDHRGRRDNARICLVSCQSVIIAVATWFIDLEILFTLGGWWSSYDLGWRKYICLPCPVFQFALIVAGIATYALRFPWTPWLFWSIPLPSWFFLSVLGCTFIPTLRSRTSVMIVVRMVVVFLSSATTFALTFVFALRNPAHLCLLRFVCYIVQWILCAIILAWKVMIQHSRENITYETKSYQPKERDLSASEPLLSFPITPAGDDFKATSINSDHLPTFTSTSDSSLVIPASHGAEMTLSEPKETTTDHYREVDWKSFENVKKWTLVEVTWDDSRPAFTITSSNKTVVLDWPRPASEPRVSAVALDDYGSDISCEFSPRPNESQIYMRVFGTEMDRPPSKRPVCDVLDIGFGNEDCTISELEARHPQARITTTEPMSILAKRCRYIPYDQNTGHWPFEENSFDLAIIRGTGGCINNPGELFRNVSGSVRPGGYVEFWGISLPRTATDWLCCSKDIRTFHPSFSLTDDGACPKEMEAAGLSLVSVSKKRATLRKSNTQDLENDLLDSAIVKLQELEKQRLLKASDHAAIPRRMKEIWDELLEARSHVNIVKVTGQRPGTQETTQVTWHRSDSRDYYNTLRERFLEPNVDGYSTCV